MIAAVAAARARCDELREAGRELARRPIAAIVESLERACARWREPDGAERSSAESALALHYGVPERAIAVVLDAAFERWDAAAMKAWIDSELGSMAALDRPVAIGEARRMAIGPELVVALSARGVPTTPLVDIVASLLVKAPIWLKPATGSDDLVERFARTLSEVDPLLGSAVETASWTSRSAVGQTVLEAAEVVVATGRDETMTVLRRAVDPGARLVIHGPRLSAALIGRGDLTRDREGVLAALADDVAFAGQSGCLSPVVAWIEAPPPELAALIEPLHAALVERWPGPPRSEAEPRERARFAEWLALASVEREAKVAGPIAGGFESSWSVQARTRAQPPDPPPVPRLLFLAPLEEVGVAAELCARRRGTVATLGIALDPSRAEPIAPSLARAGVERIAPLGSMQRPPLAWRRDGRPTLADLVRWFDREG
ncbi:MAG: acyl-CoA reductase [Gemmatimonadota bacterium]